MDKTPNKMYSNKNGHFLELDLKDKKCGQFVRAWIYAVDRHSGKQQTSAGMHILLNIWILLKSEFRQEFAQVQGFIQWVSVKVPNYYVILAHNIWLFFLVDAVNQRARFIIQTGYSSTY